MVESAWHLEFSYKTIPHRKQSSHSPQPARLKKTTSFSTRFRSFRNRRTILAGHSMENITQLTPPLNVSLTYQQPTQQRLPKSSSQCISLSLTPPPSPTPSCHVVDVVSSTDSCSKIARSGNCHPTLAACDFVYTSVQPSQLCADVSNVSGLDTTAEYSTHSEIGNLDGLLQTLEQKFKEHTSTILSNLDPHASLVTTSVRKKRCVCVCVWCVRKKRCVCVCVCVCVWCKEEEVCVCDLSLACVCMI